MREDVVRAAADLIAAKGLHGVSMADVASAAGIRTPSVYRIFPDRYALFDAVLAYALRHLQGVRDEILAADPSPAEQVKATTYSYVRHSAEGRIDRRLLFRALVDGDVETLRHIRDFRAQGVDELVAAIAELVGPERAWSTYFAIFTLATGLVQFRPFLQLLHEAPPLDAKQVANELLAMTIPAVNWPEVRLLAADEAVDGDSKNRPEHTDVKLELRGPTAAEVRSRPAKLAGRS